MEQLCYLVFSYLSMFVVCISLRGPVYSKSKDFCNSISRARTVSNQKKNPTLWLILPIEKTSNDTTKRATELNFFRRK